MEYKYKFTDEPFGRYVLRGYRKFLHSLSLALSNSFLSFKIALVLRKLTLQNKLEIVDAAPLRNIDVRLYPLDNTGDRLVLFMPWFFEWEEFKLIDELMPEGGTFVDVGANTGYYSFIASKKVGAKGRVISLEPNPVMYNRLMYNLSLNEGLENISTYQQGLSDKKGSFRLGLEPGGNLGGASIVQANDVYFVEVDCVPMLDFLKGIKGLKGVDFLKIDVEGAEPMILNPFFKDAPKSLWPKLILIETTSDIPFEQFGYERIRKTKNNTLFRLTT